MKTSTKNFKSIMYGVVALFVVTFLTGFLQSTKYEFVIYLFYLILFVVGVKLIIVTVKSKATWVLKAFLFLVGFSLMPYFLFFIIAVINNLLLGSGITEVMELVEDALYLVSLLLVIGVIGSLVLCKTRNIK